MKIYISAMSWTRARALQQADAFSPTIMEHLIKLLVYSDIREQDVNAWIHTIAVCLHLCDDILLKPRNSKLKPKDFMNSLFSCMGDEVKDYRRCLDIFRQDNYLGKFNYEGKAAYPDFEPNTLLATSLMNMSYDLIEMSMPLLTSKADNSLSVYTDIVRDIVNNLSSY